MLKTNVYDQYFFYKLFLDGGRYHIETSPSPLICSANQWTGFYMITASVMKELTVLPIAMSETI